jgi:hypothetical protein
MFCKLFDRAILIGVTVCGIAFASETGTTQRKAEAPPLTSTEVEQLLASFSTEKEKFTLVELDELGDLRDKGYIVSDFNGDGQTDIAIAAVDRSVPTHSPRLRDAFFIIATKDRSAWQEVYTHQEKGLRFPFVAWDAERKSLLLGAGQSDADHGEVKWDAKAGKYQYVAPKQSPSGFDLLF